jgi:PUA domain protein
MYTVYKGLGNFYMINVCCFILIIVKVKNKHLLKQKNAKELIKKLELQFNESFDISVGDIFTGVIDDTVFYFVDKVPIAMNINNHVMMTVRGLLKFNPTNRFVTVDMGAVRFVTNGADVMAPGIMDADKSIEQDMPVWIRDEQHHKPLAVGVAMMNGEEMIDKTEGKAVRMIHYIGDSIWKMSDVE